MSAMTEQVGWIIGRYIFNVVLISKLGENYPSQGLITISGNNTLTGRRVQNYDRWQFDWSKYFDYLHST